MKISLIIPVYNAEATLERTLQSVAAQTFRDFEVVFVDDGSTDRSAELMNAFSETSGLSCRIVRQENRGVASARNRALDEARGDYLAFVDADDTLETTSLEQAAAAASGHPDIVGWDWTLGFEKNGRYMRQADYSTPLEALKNLMGGTMRWNLWLFLLKRELIERNSLRFIDGANMGEDMQFMIRAFTCAGKVCQIHSALYCYNAVSESSISRQFSPLRRQEIETNLAEAELSVQTSLYATALKDYPQYLKLFLKLPLLVSGRKEDYALWRNWFPEANTYAMANRALPFRKRCLQWMASKGLWAGVKLHYLFVYRLIYGIVYR